MGLGDSIYNYMVCKYYKSKGHDVTIETKFPDIFSNLGIKTTSNRIFNPDIGCSYIMRKKYRNSNQYQDVLYFAKVEGNCPLKMDRKWEPDGVYTSDFLGETKAPICLVSDLYRSSGVRNRSTLVPDTDTYNKLISALNGHFITVMIGTGPKIANGCKYDLRGKTTVIDLMALAQRSSFCLTQVGALLPICESLNVPVVAILSKGYRYSGESFINSITPKKVICGENSKCYYDDDSRPYIQVMKTARGNEKATPK